MTDRAVTHSRVFTGDKDFEGVKCPHCGGEDLVVQSLFGGSISEVLFRCNGCKTCFNWVKWRGALPPTPHDQAD